MIAKKGRKTAPAKSPPNLSDSLKVDEALRVIRAQLRRLSTRHLDIQENERRRVAVELHDGLGQMLSLLKLSIEEVANSVDVGVSSKLGKSLQRLSSQAKAAVSELRRISMNLRPATLDHFGIVATLSWYFRELEMACPDMRLERDISVNESDVPAPLKISIFRIVQEATGNAIRHGQAGRIKVGLVSARGYLKLSIEDDGRGFESAGAAVRGDVAPGLGLRSMKERAEVSGGKYELQSAPGKGTRISVGWRRVAASEARCPLIPISDAVAQSTCKSALRPEDLPEEISACLNCVCGLGRETHHEVD